MNFAKLTSIRTVTFRLVWIAFVASAGLLLIFLTADLLYSSFHRTLRPWHTVKLQNEFRAGQANSSFTFSDYLGLEDLLFREVAELKEKHFDPALDSKLSRFNPRGSILTDGITRDWNRSFVLNANPERAVALLVHGLSDGPYSMRSTAELLLARGVSVYGLRLPGHGTIPAGLDDVRWQDWSAAVRIITQEISTKKPGIPFYAFGYSTGAALLIKHSADLVLSGNTDALPRALFLYSPALGVTPFARFANVQRLVTGVGVLQKARWTNIEFEIDPFKYQSFAKNAGAQLSSLLLEVYESLSRLTAENAAEKLPPIVSFQSVVDSSVHATDLIKKLYAVVRNPKSELVMFNVNLKSGLEPFLNFSPVEMIELFHQMSTRSFQLSVVRNTSPDSSQVIERIFPPNDQNYSERDIGLAWPTDIFSLSHVAIPFPPDDLVYGYAAYRNGKKVINLGTLQMHGEKGVLLVSAADQLRLKSNPFYSYQIEKVLRRIEEDLSMRE